MQGVMRQLNKKKIILKLGDIQMQFQKKYELTSWKTRETIILGNGKYEGQVNSYMKSN